MEQPVIHKRQICYKMIVEGRTIELELHFTNGETIPVTADVRKQ